MINGLNARPNLLNLGYKPFINTTSPTHCGSSFALLLNQATTATKALRLLDCLGKATPSQGGKPLEAVVPGNVTLATITTTELSTPNLNPSAAKAKNHALPKTISKAPDPFLAALNRGVYSRLKVCELGYLHPLAYQIQTAANCAKFYLAHSSAAKLGLTFCTRPLVEALDYLENTIAQRPNYSILPSVRARTNQGEDNRI